VPAGSAYDAFGSTGKDEYFTPSWICEAARECFGGQIDLDPFSQEIANTQHVKAVKYFTRADNSLEQPWYGNVLVNPPGGRNRLGQKAWIKLMNELKACHVQDFVFIAFSTDYMQTTQGHGVRSAAEFFCIFPSKRFPYYEVDPADPTKTRPAQSKDGKVSAMRPSVIITSKRSMFAACQEHCDDLRLSFQMVTSCLI
jgi:hypothetical protein